MKVAYLFGSLNRGGTETLLLDVCQSLTPNDFDAIGIYRKSGVLEETFLASGIPFFKLVLGKNPLDYLIKLRRLIQKEMITLVHAQQPLDALLALIACVGLKTKIVLTLHGFDYNDRSKIRSFVLPRTDKNIYVSEYQQNYYIRKYNLDIKRQTVVYNGVNFSKFTPSAERVEISGLRNELGLPDHTLLLGMVGNFNEVRDQFTVCRFLKLLNEKGVDFHFIFIGKRIENDAERYDRCVDFCRQNNLTENVSFLGVRNDVPEILNQLDAFIYSTEHDTFGIAVVEAIASGIPVFVNDWEVMNEITDNAKLATLYKTKDPDDLLQKFMLFLSDKETYRQQAIQAADVVKVKYSIQNHIENLKSVYQAIDSEHNN